MAPVGKEMRPNFDHDGGGLDELKLEWSVKGGWEGRACSSMVHNRCSFVWLFLEQTRFDCESPMECLLAPSNFRVFVSSLSFQHMAPSTLSLSIPPSHSLFVSRSLSPSSSCDSFSFVQQLLSKEWKGEWGRYWEKHVLHTQVYRTLG